MGAAGAKRLHATQKYKSFCRKKFIASSKMKEKHSYETKRKPTRDAQRKKREYRSACLWWCSLQFSRTLSPRPNERNALSGLTIPRTAIENYDQSSSMPFNSQTQNRNESIQSWSFLNDNYFLLILVSRVLWFTWIWINGNLYRNMKKRDMIKLSSRVPWLKMCAICNIERKGEKTKKVQRPSVRLHSISDLLYTRVSLSLTSKI